MTSPAEHAATVDVSAPVFHLERARAALDGGTAPATRITGVPEPHMPTDAGTATPEPTDG